MMKASAKLASLYSWLTSPEATPVEPVVAAPSANPTMEQVKPGVFRIPLKKTYITDEGEFEHPQLEAGMHPIVGNWSDAEMWDQQVKNPTNTLSNYMYTMDCTIGTPTVTDQDQVSQCVFDSSTPISGTFANSFTTYSTKFWNPTLSSTAVDYGVTKKYDSIGLSWTGYKYEDVWCLGGGDVHTTVCLENYNFVQITTQNNPKTWSPPFKSFKNVNTIVGIGKSSPSDASFSFLDIAYEAGLLMNNTFTFQGVTEDEQYAHLTIGGYNEMDMASEIDW